MKCQDTLFEGNSRVVRGVFLTLVGMLLKVFFLKIIILEPGKKQNGTKISKNDFLPLNYAFYYEFSKVKNST